MPWKYNGERFIKDGNQWQDDEGVQHPWCWSRWDDEYKKSMGLVWHEVSKPIEVTTYDKFILQDGSDDLLLENNDKFILQDGDDLLLEDGDNLLSENGSENLLLESISIKLDP